MTIEEFIEAYKPELMSAIKSINPNCELDNDEIEMWIMNDESLYNWALSEEVDI